MRRTFKWNYPIFCLSTRSFVVLLFCLFISVACTGKKMTVRDAKQVSVSMQSTAFVPPPRKIDDILAVLNQPGQFDRRITAAVTAKADARPPATSDPDRLLWFYYERGFNARAVGRYNQCLSDSRQSLFYLEQVPLEPVRHQKIVAAAIAAEVLAGNFKKGRKLSERLLKMGKFSSNYYIKAVLDFAAGDFSAAERAVKNGLNQWRKDRPYMGKMSKVGAAIFYVDYDRLNALLYYIRGDYARSVAYRREALKKMERQIKAMWPYIYFIHRNKLAETLILQGKLVEAEVEARKTLKEAIGHGGKDSGVVGETIEMLGRVLLAQGRMDEAEKLIATGGRILAASGLSEDSVIIGRNRVVRGSVAVARLDFEAARGHFEEARAGLRDNRYFYEKSILRNPDVMLAFIKTGAAAELLPIVNQTWKSYQRNIGPRNYSTAEMLGIRAMARAALGQLEEALADYRRAMPILFKRRSGSGTGFGKKQHQRIIAEAYLDLLREIHQGRQATDLGVNVAQEAFALVENLAAGRVQKALGASGARAAAGDPELADLVRRDQDAQKQVLALQIALSGALATPAGQQDPAVIKELKRSIATLEKAQQVLQSEVENRFPKYAEFTDPRPVSMAELQANLSAKEALLTLYPTPHHTFVWGIPKKGKPAFAVASLGVDEQVRLVAALRKALAPDPARFGDIPEFNLGKATELYRRLLLPVRDGWHAARDLVVAVTGPLATIPLGILPTSPVSMDHGASPLFSGYKQVPWLIKKVAITRIPSATALVALRSLPPVEQARAAFTGFGDPIFNLAQLKTPAASEIGQDSLTSRGRIRVRGIRVTGSGSLDQPGITSAGIGALARLPDTREEIESIAAAMDVDPDTTVFTGRKASEKQVKTMRLDDRRVIMFATHALVPGDLDGLNQPAIALSAPDVTGDPDDGLLTMEEVLRLKLNADWVILSACNTGAADGAGAEALSGLGQAFFYAGTRALLVSMWPVETTSAKALTTGLFDFQEGVPAMSRARALRKTILDVMENQVVKDAASNRIVASYAHPLFWAPFILVGDGGR